MAMEHFDDKIAPSFRGCLSPDFDINLTYSSLSDGSRIPLTAAGPFYWGSRELNVFMLILSCIRHSSLCKYYTRQIKMLKS